MAELKTWIGRWLDYAAYKCGIILYFSKPDPPAPPDYAGAAQAQGRENRETAIVQGYLNNPNMVTPYGTRTVTWGVPGESVQAGPAAGPAASGPYVNTRGWAGINGAPNDMGGGGSQWGGYNLDPSMYQPTITETLSEGQQQLFDLNEDLQIGLMDTANDQLGRVDAAFSTPWDTSGAPQITPYAELGRDSEMTRALRERYRPEMDKREQQRLDDLIVQGHTRGGSAWGTERDDLTKERTDFELASIINGMEMQRALETDERDRYIREMAYDRNVPLNEANALRTGNQIQPYQYQAYQPTNVQAAPLFDATLASGNFAQQNYANQVDAYGGFWDGVGDLGAAGITRYSDRRLKENIERVGTWKGYPIYLFNYIWDKTRQVGVMADEVKDINPAAVSLVDGYYAVDYGRL